ncbi:MAG: TadE/TadG family type IV pilus assembly protein [Pseudomonadota bacterium]
MSVEVRPFTGESRGNVAVSMALATVPILLAVGFAVDTKRQIDTKAFVQQAVDAAAIAGVRSWREASGDMAIVNEAVEAAFEANIRTTYSDVICEDPTTFDTRNADGSLSRIEVSARCTVPTMLAGALNDIESMEVNVAAAAEPMVRRLEIAMVLDLSNSMENEPLEALKAGANLLIDKVIEDPDSSDVRVGLVPYGTGVDAGTFGRAAVGQRGEQSRFCVAERTGPEAFTDAEPDPADPATLISPAHANHTDLCPSAGRVVPLTSDRDALKTEIDALEVDGVTAGQVGIAWGWYLISGRWESFWPEESIPRPYSTRNNLKVLVIMTDGVFNHQLNAQPEAPDQAQALCREIKDRGVLVFAIAFDAAPNAEALMRECASGGSFYFDAANTDELIAAYAQIASRFNGVKIAQ